MLVFKYSLNYFEIIEKYKHFHTNGIKDTKLEGICHLFSISIQKKSNP